MPACLGDGAEQWAGGGRGWAQALYCLPVVQVAAGENHSAALTSSGTLYTWGRNKHSQAAARPTPARALSASTGARVRVHAPAATR
jgi:hypothetical protein